MGQISRLIYDIKFELCYWVIVLFLLFWVGVNSRLVYIINLFNLFLIFLFLFFLPVWSTFFLCSHSFRLVEKGMGIDGPLCWVCEMVGIFSFFLFSFLLQQHHCFTQGSLVFIFMLYLCGTFLFGFRGFSGYCIVFCEPHTQCVNALFLDSCQNKHLRIYRRINLFILVENRDKL